MRIALNVLLFVEESHRSTFDLESKLWNSHCSLMSFIECHGHTYLQSVIQWDPDFSKPRFPEPPDISNQNLFPLDLLHSSSII